MQGVVGTEVNTACSQDAPSPMKGQTDVLMVTGYLIPFQLTIALVACVFLQLKFREYLLTWLLDLLRHKIGKIGRKRRQEMAAGGWGDEGAKSDHAEREGGVGWRERPRPGWCGWLVWKRHPTHQRAVSSAPGQGTYLGGRSPSCTIGIQGGVPRSFLEHLVQSRHLKTAEKMRWKKESMH